MTLAQVTVMYFEKLRSKRAVKKLPSPLLAGAAPW